MAQSTYSKASDETRLCELSPPYLENIGPGDLKLFCLVYPP
jgi:hypothetical protein